MLWRKYFQSQLCNKLKSQFSTLVIGEAKDDKLKKNFFKILKGSQQFKEDTHLLIFGSKLSQVISHVQSNIASEYVSKLIVADSPNCQNIHSDLFQLIVQNLIDQFKYTQVICDSSSFGRDVLPRVAATYGCQPISDVIQIKDKDTFKRPVYAGNAIATVRSKDKIKFLTLRQTAFEEINYQQAKVAPIKDILNLNVEEILKSSQVKIRHVSEQIIKSDRPELTSARIVISGGRGMKSKENFKILDDLANVLGDSAIGASRAAVDAGFASNDQQVGQTGKVVAPELYLAVGISGAIQHVAGMKDSKVIVAVNKDSEAPIFEVSTYGIVGDLFNILPEFTQKIKKIVQK